jgi:hypothetical protein
MKMLRLLCALTLCSALGMSVACGGSDGDDGDATPAPDAMPVMEADMNEPEAMTPDMTPEMMPEMMAECGNGECEEGEDEVNCPADSPPPRPSAKKLGPFATPRPPSQVTTRSVSLATRRTRA